MLNAVSCNPLIFFSLLWLTNLFLKAGFCRAESQYYSPFTTVELTTVSSHLLFPKQLKCLSFFLLTPFSGLFDSYSSKTPLQDIFSLCTVALSLFSLPTKLYTSLDNFNSWSCLPHLPHTFFSYVQSQDMGFFLPTFIQFQFPGSCFPDPLLLQQSEDLKNITLRERLQMAS